MKYWTALQYPFSQAVLVEDGRIIHRIPENPPKTPANAVKCVSEFDGKLVVGRTTSIELWEPDGSHMISTFYHPYIIGLHEIHQYKDMFLVICAGLDVAFLMNQDCQSVWSWWAHQANYCPKIEQVDSDEWPMLQVTGKCHPFMKQESHLNSGRIYGDQILLSLLRSNLIVQVSLFGSEVKEICSTDHGVHSPIFTSNGLVYGTDKGVRFETYTLFGYEWVKRIYELPDSTFLLTHECGVRQIDCHGKILVEHILPRPFGIALFTQ